MATVASDLQTVRVEQDGGVTRLILNRADDGNGVDAPTLAGLRDTLARLAAQPDVRALILTGAGADFCRGRIPPRREKPPTAMDVRDELEGILAVNRALRDFPHPTIAAVEGRALGFGAGLAAHCDVTIAADTAKFSFPEILNNLPPLIVLSYLGRVIPRKIALDLVLTARTLAAADALRIGLVTEVVAAGRALARAQEVAAGMLERDPQAILLARRFAREAMHADEETASEYGITMLAAYLSSRTR
jgi:enoyl-CoA hydratase/carnithine racemase